MALSSAANGTQVAVISSEHSLAIDTVAGVYILKVDVTNMVDGDELELRLKAKVLTGGSSIETIIGIYVNAQTEDVVYSIPLSSVYSIEATLKQTAGTGRSYDWNLERV
ncbi:MAG: hypothetical protein KAJ03_04440 [Gammaproteobacteria bacterium]|nr:hypothetical protein [Gammaproteobacteria bacterium]